MKLRKARDFRAGFGLVCVWADVNPTNRSVGVWVGERSAQVEIAA